MRRLLPFLASFILSATPLVAQADSTSIADLTPTTPTPAATPSPTSVLVFTSATPTATPTSIPVTGAPTGLALVIAILFIGSLTFYAATAKASKR